MTRRASFIAECFWPGVTEADLATLDLRVRDVTAGRDSNRSVLYRGATLVREDEVVLCEFEGTAVAVREVAELARVPFERIVETAHSPWSSHEERNA